VQPGQQIRRCQRRRSPLVARELVIGQYVLGVRGAARGRRGDASRAAVAARPSHPPNAALRALSAIAALGDFDDAAVLGGPGSAQRVIGAV
jgi:hypothetical protein